MPLRLQPSVSILLSGTCAFLGWWWWRRYTSRNKGQLQGHNEDIGSPVCLHTSAQDRSNGLMGKSCTDVAPCDSNTDHPKGKAEGGLEEQIYVKDVSRTSSPPSGVEDLASRGADAAGKHGDDSDQMYDVAEAVRPADMRSPQLGLELLEEDHISMDVAHYSTINTSGPLPGEMPDTATLEEVELPNAVRPQPVGEEVVCDKTTVPFMSSQADLVGGDQRSIPAAGEQACMWACRDMHRCEPGVAPGTSPCCTVPASLATRGAADPQDNGLPAEATDINTSIGEIQQLATRIVAGVISAAVELMRESSRHDSAKAEEDLAQQEEEEGSGSLSDLTGGATVSSSQPRPLQDAAMLMDVGLTTVEPQDLPRRSLSDVNGADAEADQQVVLEAQLSRAAREVQCCLASRPCANAEGEYGAEAREEPPREEERAGSRNRSGLTDGTPVSSSQPCPVQEAVMDGGLTTVEPQDLPRGALSDVRGADADQQVPAEANGCLASRTCAVTKDECAAETGPETVLVKAKEGVVSPVLASLKAEEAVAGSEDSGCSTCHSDEWMSSEDLLHSSGLSCAAPNSTEDASPLSGACRRGLERRALIASVRKVMGLPDAGLYNGTHTSEMEADQSGGSDVNSMDSVEGSSMGEPSHSRGSQPPQPQTSELVIWEIEVPKHLVGRLIGKQGRFVSYLKLNSGAKIYVSTLPYTQDFQICHIEGMQHQVDKALTLIGKKFKDLDLANLYAPPHPPIGLPSLPMTSWLLLPNGVMVEVIVVSIVSAGHVFVQQHTHPTYHALRSLDQQMYMCYSQPGTPCLPCPVKVGVICAAPAVEGAWWRAQVISYYKDSEEVEIRYVDYGGYDRVKVDVLRQIRSDFVTLPFQGAEVLLDNLAPLPGADRFSAEASAALGEMTRGVALLTEVTNYDNHTGLPLVQLWNVVGDELVSVNRTLAERGLGTWVDSF